MIVLTIVGFSLCNVSHKHLLSTLIATVQIAFRNEWSHLESTRKFLSPRSLIQVLGAPFEQTIFFSIFTFNPRPHMLFSHPRTHMVGFQPPYAISPLIKIELWDKEQTNPWDVLNPMVPELTSLSHILTPPGRVKEKMIAI